MSDQGGILAFMVPPDETLDRICQVQRRNAVLAGAELVAAANGLTELLVRLRARPVAADGTGDRIIGAASALRPQSVHPADMSARLDGQTILLVSGAIAGAVGLTQDARRLHRLGACAVHLAVLDGWNEDVPGSASTHPLTTEARTGRGRTRSHHAA